MAFGGSLYSIMDQQQSAVAYKSRQMSEDTHVWLLAMCILMCFIVGHDLINASVMWWPGLVMCPKGNHHLIVVQILRSRRRALLRMSGGWVRKEKKCPTNTKFPALFLEGFEKRKFSKFQKNAIFKAQCSI